MRRIWGFLLFISLLACQSAEDAEPGNAETYIKLIGGESQDVPEKFLILEGADGEDNGLIILGTSENESLGSFRIRLTRLDNKGNTIWERNYPEKDSTDLSYIGRSIIAVNDGYFIVGDSIKNELEADDGEEIESRSGLLVMKVDLDGMLLNNMMKTETLDESDLRGQDIMINQDGDLVVISEIISDEQDEDILLMIFAIGDLSVLCSQQYTGGDISIAPSLLTDPSGDYVFAGTVTDFGSQNSRIFKVPSECSPNLISGPLLVQGNSNNYVVNQIIETVNGFAIVGTTDDVAAKTDIFMARLDPFGVLQGEIIIYDQIDGKNVTDEEEGLTIAATSDGGFVLSGSTRSNTDAGETNIVLIKVNASGNVQWTNQFGDLNEEEGTLVQEASNGGFYILGNTEFGGLDTIIIIRTDSEGNVE